MGSGLLSRLYCQYLEGPVLSGLHCQSLLNLEKTVKSILAWSCQGALSVLENWESTGRSILSVSLEFVEYSQWHIVSLKKRVIVSLW